MKKILLISAFVLSAISCSNNSDPVPVTAIVTPPTSNAIAYVKGSLNGQPVDFTQTNAASPYVYGYYNGYDNGPGYFDRSYHYGSNMQLSNNVAFLPSYSLVFSNMFNSSSGLNETTVFHSLFTTVPTNLLTAAQESALVKGLHFDYTSAANVSYSSLEGSQTGSIVTITSATPSTEDGSTNKIITIVGTISCKLYNYNNAADVLTFTNGSFKLIFREYI